MKKLICQLIVIFLLVSIVNADTIEITGCISNIKTSAPYPFTTADGRVWECKVKVPYWAKDEDTGEWELYDYKLYPLRGSGYKWVCNLPDGKMIHFVAKRKKSRHKGDIVWLEVL